MGKYSEYPAYTESPHATDKVLIYCSIEGAEKLIDYSLFTTRPHINLSDTSTKLISNTAAEYACTYDTQSDKVGITHTLGDSKIYVPATGIYLTAISALLSITSPPAALFDLWIKVNGVNVANSNTQMSISSTGLQLVMAVTFVLQLNANDYFEVFYHGSTNKVQMLAVAAQTGPPVIPACPSIIVAVSKIGS